MIIRRWTQNHEPRSTFDMHLLSTCTLTYAPSCNELVERSYDGGKSSANLYNISEKGS